MTLIIANNIITKIPVTIITITMGILNTIPTNTGKGAINNINILFKKFIALL